MKQICSLLAGLTVCAMVVGQSVYGPTNDSLYLGFYRDSIALLERPTIIISPFHPKRYISEIDHEIAKGTNYNFQHTRGFFRKGLDNALIIAAKEHNDYVNLHADDPVLNEDLDFLYKVVSVSVVPYEPPVIESDQGFKSKLASYWERIQTNVDPAPDPGTRIEQGQIVSVADHRELISKARVVNRLGFDSLAPKYEADYFIFINEINFFNAASNQQELESDRYNRLIKVHYSVYDKDGIELFSLVKKRYFSSYQNDLPSIITDEILPVGYDVIHSLDSYRFLQAGLTPLTESETEPARTKKGMKLPPLPKFK